MFQRNGDEGRSSLTEEVLTLRNRIRVLEEQQRTSKEIWKKMFHYIENILFLAKNNTAPQNKTSDINKQKPTQFTREQPIVVADTLEKLGEVELGKKPAKVIAARAKSLGDRDYRVDRVRRFALPRSRCEVVSPKKVSRHTRVHTLYNPIRPSMRYPRQKRITNGKRLLDVADQKDDYKNNVRGIKIREPNWDYNTQEMEFLNVNSPNRKGMKMGEITPYDDNLEGFHRPGPGYCSPTLVNSRYTQGNVYPGRCHIQDYEDQDEIKSGEKEGHMKKYNNTRSMTFQLPQFEIYTEEGIDQNELISFKPSLLGVCREGGFNRDEKEQQPNLTLGSSSEEADCSLVIKLPVEARHLRSSSTSSSFK